MLATILPVCNPETNVATNEVAMEQQSKNIDVIQSVWRRLKKGHIKIRDLPPVKDVKGGAGVTDKSEPTTDNTGTRRNR